MSPPLLLQDITMTSETEETVLDPRSLVKALLQAHDDWSDAAGTPLYGKAADALNRAEAAVVAALSRAPEAEDLGGSTRMTSPASRSQTPLSARWGDRPQDDTPWVRGDEEKPVYDGFGERYLLTWSTRSSTYDIGCIDGNWSAGETIDTSRGELWRWLDVNPERHLPAGQPLSDGGEAS